MRSVLFLRAAPSLAAGLLTLVVSLLVPAVAWAAEPSAFAQAVERSLLSAAGVAFLGGVLVSLTPCVYPMIAITVSVFGARKTTSHLHGFGLSSAFVAGIIAMFTPLGVVAGMTGSLFGSVLQNPWVLTGIACLFIAMAASMLGAFELALPSSITNKLAQVGGVGPKGAFGLGLVCGVIAAPCTGPVLTGILTWIAKTQSATAGALAMLSFSLGLGLPFLIVGTFAVRLPKSGPWMIHVKSFLAIVLSLVALHFLNTAFPSLAAWVPRTSVAAGIALFLVLLGLALGALHREFDRSDLKDSLLKGTGTAMTTLAAFVLLLWYQAPSAGEAVLKWQRVQIAEARVSALKNKQPMLVDFTAAWCGACKELEKKTFSDPAVSHEAGRFLAVQVDATDDEDPLIARTMSDLGVVGLPTVLLIDSTGKEVRRFTDFVEAPDFLSALRDVK